MKGLLNPSPPFTTLHPVQGISAEPPTYHKGRSSLMTGTGLHWWLELVFIDDWSWSSLMAKPLLEKRLHSKKWWGWRVGEGWWRVKTTLHPYKSFIYRRLRRLGEGWRVFLKVALYSTNSAKLLRKMWEIGQKVLRKMWEIAAKLLRKMWVFNIKLLCKMW